MRAVLDLHLAGQTTPDIQIALSAHLPTCVECLSVAQGYAQASSPVEPPQTSGYPASVYAATYPTPPPPPLAGPGYGGPTAADLEALALATHEGQTQPTAAQRIGDPPSPEQPLTEQQLAEQQLAAAQHAAEHAAASRPTPARASDDDDVLPGPVRAIIDVALWGTFVVVVAIAILVVPDVFEPPEYTTAGRVAPGVRIAEVRIARRRPDGSIELLAGNTIAPKDRLAFSYLHTATWERLMILVTDENDEIYWQFPDWTDRRAPAYAPTILVDRRIQVVPAPTHRDWEGKLLTVRWIFTRDFITTRQVEERLSDPERDTTKPLFPDTLERQQLIVVDPAAADVAGVPQIDPNEVGTSKIDSYLRLSPSR